ncbi:unnamed protein product, partial [Strongylus vulgaris]
MSRLTLINALPEGPPIRSVFPRAFSPLLSWEVTGSRSDAISKKLAEDLVAPQSLDSSTVQEGLVNKDHDTESQIDTMLDAPKMPDALSPAYSSKLPWEITGRNEAESTLPEGPTDRDHASKTHVVRRIVLGTKLLSPSNEDNMENRLNPIQSVPGQDAVQHTDIGGPPSYPKSSGTIHSPSSAQADLVASNITTTAQPGGAYQHPQGKEVDFLPSTSSKELSRPSVSTESNTDLGDIKITPIEAHVPADSPSEGDVVTLRGEEEKGGEERGSLLEERSITNNKGSDKSGQSKQKKEFVSVEDEGEAEESADKERDRPGNTSAEANEDPVDFMSENDALLPHDGQTDSKRAELDNA